MSADAPEDGFCDRLVAALDQPAALLVAAAGGGAEGGAGTVAGGSVVELYAEIEPLRERPAA